MTKSILKNKPVLRHTGREYSGCEVHLAQPERWGWSVRRAWWASRFVTSPYLRGELRLNAKSCGLNLAASSIRRRCGRLHCAE